MQEVLSGVKAPAQAYEKHNLSPFIVGRECRKQESPNVIDIEVQIPATIFLPLEKRGGC